MSFYVDVNVLMSEIWRAELAQIHSVDTPYRSGPVVKGAFS